MENARHEVHAVSLYSQNREVTLCEVLDRVLDKGAVLTGELVISVAEIELLYVGVNILVSSVETLLESMEKEQELNQYKMRDRYGLSE